MPAPTAGWVTSKNLGQMKPDEAITLDNWFPEEDECALRGGSTSHATGIGSGNVETLMEYGGLTGDKLLAAGNNAIYNVTSAGAVGAALSSSHTSNRWQYTNFGTSAGQYLVMVNGADTPQKYDGSTISTTTITGTGLTATDLINVSEHKERLIFCEKDTLSFWYLAVNAISGAASEFPLHSLAKWGGYLMASSTWTRDAGDGMDDLSVFVTSKGEVIVYAGTDPSNSSTWSLVGIYRTAPPIGRRCMIKVGSELIIITKDGFLPLSKIMTMGRLSGGAEAISANIAPTVSYAAQNYGSNFGWQGILYPKKHMGIFNIPTSTSEKHQYVVNTNTGAWCRFTGMNANCWALLGDDLYYGGTDGVVYKADTGTDDNGTNIKYGAKQAFSYFGDKGRKKKFTNVRPIFYVNGTITLGLGIDIDFGESVNPTYQAVVGTSGIAWDAPYWDVEDWSPEGELQKDWRGVTGIGRCASLVMRFQSSNITGSWRATDWQWVYGDRF